MKAHLRVIVGLDGDVIATQRVALPGDAPAPWPEAQLIALPGQTMHEIEMEAPAIITSPADIAEFHEAVRSRLKVRA